jgi:hypothetical protein
MKKVFKFKIDEDDDEIYTATRCKLGYEVSWTGPGDWTEFFSVREAAEMLANGEWIELDPA